MHFQMQLCNLNIEIFGGNKFKFGFKRERESDSRGKLAKNSVYFWIIRVRKNRETVRVFLRAKERNECQC